MRARLLLLAGLLAAQIGASAAPVVWFRPSEPGSVPAVVQIGADQAAVLRLSDAVRARGFAHANWRPAGRPEAKGLSEALARGRALDRSRVALVAAGDAVADAWRMAAAQPAALRALVLQVDAPADWAEPRAGAATWPALLLTYAADRPDVRASTFALARKARAAGAQVWVQPAAGGDAAAVAAWLAALEAKRTRRFEDASVEPYRGARHAALVESLAKIAPRRPGVVALAGIVEADGTRRADLVLDTEGRMQRLAQGVAEAEFDARGALATVFGDEGLALHIGPASAQFLRHPETGAEVLALPTTIATDAGVRSLLMLRHADGSYAWLDLDDGRGIRALTASTDAADQGRVWWLLMDAADARGSRVLRVALQPGDPRRGLWWDPSRPGHALDLQPILGGHSAVFSTFDDDGQSRWYLATGRIAAQRFVAGKDGLQLMRRDPALSAPKPDPRHAGRIAIDFAVDARHPVCAQRRAEAAQLAVLTVSDARGTRQWCIEPVALPPGLPDADVNGTWYGGANDSGWGLTVVASGAAESGLMSAMLYYHDAEGWPRWAMGAARAGQTGAALSMHDYAQTCVGCADAKLTARPLGELRLRAAGWCAQPELRASFELTTDPNRRFVRGEAGLQRVTESRCH